MAMDIIARAAIGTAVANAAAAIGRTAYVDRFADLSATSFDPSVTQIITGGNAAAGTGGARYAADSTANAALAAAHPRACRIAADGRYFRLLPDPDGAVPAEACKLPADTDDSAAAISASKYAFAIGLTHIKLSPRKWTLASSGEFANSTAIWPGAGDWMSFWPGIVCDTNGATLRAAPTLSNGVGSAVGQGGVRGIDYRGIFRDANTAGVITAPFSNEADTFTVNTTAGYAPNDWVLYRFGDVGYDRAETYTHGIARVTAVNAGNSTVTLDCKIPRGFDAAALADATGENKTVRRIAPMVGVNFGDIVFDDDLTGGYTGAEHAVVIKQAINCRFGQVGGRALSVGAFIAQYCYEMTIDRVFNSGSRGSGTDKGNGGRFAECRGIHIGQYVMRDIDRVSLALEGASVVAIDYFEDDNRRADATYKPIVLNGRSHLSIRNALFTGKGGLQLCDPIDNSQLTIENLHIRTSTPPSSLGGPLRRMVTGKLTLEIAGASPEVYNVNNGMWLPFKVNLRDGATIQQQITPPNCLIGGLMIYASNGVALTGLQIDRQDIAGTGSDVAAQITPGSWTTFDIGFGANDTKVNAAGRDIPVRFTVGTGAGNEGKVIEGFIYAIPAASVDAYSGPVAQGASAVGLMLSPGSATMEVVNATVGTLAAGAESGWIYLGMNTITPTPGRGRAGAWIQGAPYDLAVNAVRVHPTGSAVEIRVKNFGSSSVATANYDFRVEYQR